MRELRNGANAHGASGSVHVSECLPNNTDPFWRVLGETVVVRTKERFVIDRNEVITGVLKICLKCGINRGSSQPWPIKTTPTSFERARLFADRIPKTEQTGCHLHGRPHNCRNARFRTNISFYFSLRLLRSFEPFTFTPILGAASVPSGWNPEFRKEPLSQGRVSYQNRYQPKPLRHVSVSPGCPRLIY